MKKQTDKPGNIHCSTAVHMANLVNMLSESEYKLCFLGATKIKKKNPKKHRVVAVAFNRVFVGFLRKGKLCVICDSHAGGKRSLLICAPGLRFPSLGENQ